MQTYAQKSWTREVLPQHRSHLALRNAKNRRLLWFGEQIGNIRGRKTKITSGHSEHVLVFFDHNLPPQKTTSETLLLGVYKSQNWKGLKHSVTAFCAVVVNDKVCPQAYKVPDIHKFTGSERLHPNVLRDSAAANARAPTTTFERLQWQKKVQSDNVIITIFLSWPWFAP